MVSTADDLVAFGRMMLNGGEYGGKRVLSEASIRAMRKDQLTPEQKAISGLNPDDFAHRGWGLGMSLVTSKDTIPFSVGTFGWDGGMGTSLYCDPVEDLITVLLTQRAWPAPVAPRSFRDFWNAAYAARSPGAS
jgi:CubicO group peptidase (beta-lactamase class C family)